MIQRFLLIILIGISVLSLSLLCCNDEEPKPDVCIPNEEEGRANVCTAACGDFNGAFCSLFQKLWDLCLFEDTELTRGDIGQIAIELNEFWDTLAEEMQKETFDKNAILQYLDETVLSEENQEILKIAVSGIFINQDMTSPTNSPTCTEYKHYMNYITDIDTCDCPCSGGIWSTVYEYSQLMGVTGDDACFILTAAFGGLNDAFNLASDGEAPADSIMESLDTECAFDSNNAHSTANLETFAIYITTDGETKEDWFALSEQMIDNEISTLLNIFVDMLYNIHDKSTNLDLVLSLLPTIPGLVSGFISPDMSQCE